MTIRLHHIPTLLLALALLLPAPCFADKTKAASAMSREALTAYDSADYFRAMNLFVQAYKTDPKPEFLFGAARSAHLSGNLERADELYGQFIAAPDADAARVQRAKGYLQDLRLARADAKAMDAEKAQTRGEHGLAARLWLDAQVLDTKRVELLLKAGRAQAEAGDKPAAAAAFRQYLAQAPANAADCEEARVRLAALEPAPLSPVVVAVPVAAPQPPTKAKEIAAVVVRSQPQPTGTSGRKIAGWTTLGVGGALGVASLVVYLLASKDSMDLQNAYTTTDSTGHITGLSHDDAIARQNSIDSRETAALVMAGVGVAAIGVGTWLWLSDKTDVALVPTLNGAQWGMRW